MIAVGGEYRVDPETGDWHIVSPERAARPTDISAATAIPCPFCPGQEAMTPPEVLRVPADPGTPWRVRVVPNRFPIVGPADGATAATGRHEVVIESPHHDGDLRLADPEQTAEVLAAMRERCRALAATGAAAVVVFRNHGAAAGTSLRHPHSQIVALDDAPPGLLRRWRNARRFHTGTGLRMHDEIAAGERRERVRIVHDGAGILVYQPPAASMPHETVLLPDGNAPGLARASDGELDAVAGVLPAVLAGLAAVRDDPAYNLVVHAGPAGDPAAGEWYRWHIGLYPRVTRRAGLEIATGLTVNPTRPEDTAPQLREAVSARL